MNPREGFIYSTPSQNLTLGSKLSVYIENPSNSGKNLIVEKYCYPNQASGFLDGTFYATYNKNVGAVALPAQSFRIGSNQVTPVAVVSYYGGAAGGSNGTYFPLQSADVNETISAPLIIEPGYGFAIEISATVSAKVSFQMYTREVNA